MPELIANRYRIDRPLGAAAFQAFDLQLSRTVVVKMLPAQRAKELRLARQFHQEARAAARLTHPNIVAVYDVYENGAHPGGTPNEPDPFMVSEWLPGDDLRTYLAGRQPLPSEDGEDPFERKLDILAQVCRGLHQGHENGLVHGSVDPENIRVTQVREIKIVNFGITPLTKRGSRHYLSPEQLEGQTERDRRSDVFSVGVILYELLFGVHPFRADTEEATRSRILACQYARVDDLLPGAAARLIEIVKRSLARSPDDRFPDCRLLESELKMVRSRLEEEKEECRARLVSLRATLKKNTRSQDPAQARLVDLAVLESADPKSEDYEHLLRSCNELGAVIERVKHQTQIEKTVDSVREEANAGELENGLARLAEVLRIDPGNQRAQSLQALMQRREQVRSLLQEARQAEAAHDLAMACIIALQAVQLDPDAADAKAEFDRMQALLRQRKEQALVPSSRNAAVRAEGHLVPAPTLPRTGVLNPRLLTRVAPILGLLLMLGIGWALLTRDATGPSPVSARNVPAPATPSPPVQAVVSLDVVPWAKVDSIIDLKDGRPVEHEQLESPCTFRLPVGRYAMTVSHPEFGSRLLRVEVKEGVTNRVKASLLSDVQLEKEIETMGR